METSWFLFMRLRAKANQVLAALLAGHFSVAKAAVKILHGHSFRKKLVSIGMP
jgi:uncharacterized protein YggU (UPF0235/DUF167 family)